MFTNRAQIFAAD